MRFYIKTCSNSVCRNKKKIILEVAGISLTRRSQSSVTLLFLCLLTLWLCLQELEALRGGEAARLRELSAEQRELRCELEAVHSEQSRQLSQARQEQLDLETRLEQLRQQACACEPGAQRQQEARYAEQVQMKVALLSTAHAIYNVLIGLHYLSMSSGETSQIFAWYKRTSEPLVRVWLALGCSISLLFVIEAAVPPGLLPVATKSHCVPASKGGVHAFV